MPTEDPSLKTGSNPPAPVAAGARTVDGTLPVRYIGAVPMAWRKAGESYVEGTFIADNTFVVQCIKGGKTDAKNQWGLWKVREAGVRIIRTWTMNAYGRR